MDTVSAIITATGGAIVTILTSILAFYKVKTNSAKAIHKLKMEERDREETRDDNMHRYYVDKLESISNGRIEKLIAAMHEVNTANTNMSNIVSKLCDAVDSQWKIQRDCSAELTKAITELRLELSKQFKN